MFVMLPVEIIRLRDLFLNLCFDFVDIFITQPSSCWLVLLLEHSDIVHALKPKIIVGWGINTTDFYSCLLNKLTSPFCSSSFRTVATCARRPLSPPKASGLGTVDPCPWTFLVIFRGRKARTLWLDYYT